MMEFSRLINAGSASSLPSLRMASGCGCSGVSRGELSLLKSLAEDAVMARYHEIFLYTRSAQYMAVLVRFPLAGDMIPILSLVNV